MFFTIASAFATYERDLIKERVVSGLQNAKKKRKVLGRKSNLNGLTKSKILEMFAPLLRLSVSNDIVLSPYC